MVGPESQLAFGSISSPQKTTRFVTQISESSIAAIAAWGYYEKNNTICDANI
jgi:hypothetical protein